MHITGYKPGSCNIGPAEVRRRYRIGYMGLVGCVIIIILLEVISASRGWKLMLIIPAFYSLSGFIQAKNKFCYIYGYKGLFSMPGRKTFSRVPGENLSADKRKAIQLIILITALSFLVTAIYYFLF